MKIQSVSGVFLAVHFRASEKGREFTSHKRRKTHYSLSGRQRHKKKGLKNTGYLYYYFS